MHAPAIIIINHKAKQSKSAFAMKAIVCRTVFQQTHIVASQSSKFLSRYLLLQRENELQSDDASDGAECCYNRKGQKCNVEGVASISKRVQEVH